MKKLLLVDSSPRIENSISRTLTDEVAQRWLQHHEDGVIIHRDVGLTPPSHLSEELIEALRENADDDIDEHLKAELLLSQQIIEEFTQADAVVIGSPMFNFGVTSQLKGWIDRLVVPGKTFEYTQTGPQGLVQDKPIFIIMTRGGYYHSPEMQLLDHQEPYLQSILNFIGVRSVTMIRVEGIDISSDLRATALMDARDQIHEMLL